MKMQWSSVDSSAASRKPYQQETMERVCETQCDKDCSTANSLPLQEVCSKAEVLAYRHTHLVKRLEKKLKISPKKAQKLFVAMLQFLYICGVERRGRNFSPSPMVDEAWHNFILFTKDYDDFCRIYFGQFIHHRPFTDEYRGSGKSDETLEVLVQHFGQLSSFWVKNAPEDCSQCAPDRDCNGGGNCG